MQCFSYINRIGPHALHFCSKVDFSEEDEEEIGSFIERNGIFIKVNCNNISAIEMAYKIINEPMDHRDDSMIFVRMIDILSSMAGDYGGLLIELKVENLAQGINSEMCILLEYLFMITDSWISENKPFHIVVTELR